jgi:hypothetical protein
MSVTASLGEARELYQIIVECEAKLDSLETKSKQTGVTFADLYLLMNRALMLLRRSGLPDDVVAAIATVQRLIAATHSLYVAMTILTTAMATTPAGMILAGLGVATSILSVTSAIGSYQ